MSAPKQSQQWIKLDNAAKIFPSTSTKRDTKVFRFSCELWDAVDPVALQSALARTIAKFPFYRYVLKRGLFWYYFEESRLVPTVHAEARPPCAPLYNGNRKNLLFEVSYHKRRINLEVYHALSDGTGALHFLRRLVLHYLTEVHSEELGELSLSWDYNASLGQRTLDSFQKYYGGKRGNAPIAPAKSPKAFRLRGERLPDCRLGIVEGLTPASALAALCRERGVTISEFLIANLICSIHDNMSLREEARPVVITVPVNLRRFFPSQSARNFFSVIATGYNFKELAGSFDDVLGHVHAAFQNQLTADALQQRLNQLAALEHSLPTKLVPLVLKDPVLRYFSWLSDREITAAFSNLGRITMPEALSPYIRLFDVFVSSSRPQICLCSYGDNLMISFTSPFVSTDIQRCFFQRLTGLGLEVEITASLAGME